jgi:hypothetical protein
MRDAKHQSDISESKNGGQRIARLSALNTLAVPSAKGEPVETAVPLIPAWKAAAQARIAKRVKAVVKGPIRCHKCQLMCIDAEHYLGHQCDVRREINELRSR